MIHPIDLQDSGVDASGRFVEVLPNEVYGESCLGCCLVGGEILARGNNGMFKTVKSGRVGVE